MLEQAKKARKGPTIKPLVFATDPSPDLVERQQHKVGTYGMHVHLRELDS